MILTIFNFISSHFAPLSSQVPRAQCSVSEPAEFPAQCSIVEIFIPYKHSSAKNQIDKAQGTTSQLENGLFSQDASQPLKVAQTICVGIELRKISSSPVRILLFLHNNDSACIQKTESYPR